MMSPSWIIIMIFVVVSFFSCLASVNSQPLDYPTANISTSWINSVSADNSVRFTDNSTVRAILLRGTFGPKYACGFYCNGNCETYLFAIFIVQTNRGGGITLPSRGFPQVVWSANRNNPVRINATLELTGTGDLILRDADGALAWSTNTAGKSVVGLNLTEEGNLILFDAKKSVVWQSFDHPTDSLVPGQRLVSGMNLTASASTTNWTEGGLYSLSMTDTGLIGFVQSVTPLIYYYYPFPGTKKNVEASYVKYRNGSLDFFVNGVEPLSPDQSISFVQTNDAQYMKLGPDGHLRVYQWGALWTELGDILTIYLGDCRYPMACGKYGICSYGICSCPPGFREITYRRPDLGCSQVIPVNCNDSSKHSFLDLVDATYFTFVGDISGIDMHSCKEACLKNCSCKAAIFRYASNSSKGGCYLPSEIFSLRNKGRTNFNYSVSLKVQIAQNMTTSTLVEANVSLLGPILGSIAGLLLVAVFIGIVAFICRRRRRRRFEEEADEEYLNCVPGMPNRFSFQELETATDNFNNKIGDGGFGSVFEGSFNDGTRIAVKRLHGVGHIKKSFLAEVQSIGSIHHINLVRLIGFCAEKSQWLLVYEYMLNGSLDRWIYCRGEGTTLGWNNRSKIILDIAKGLAYLHEDCRQKIIHLDIKPQNILLDEHHNAKLADFGLSKLIDRNQCQVVTTMRGTPGYLAPEWLGAVITEKVDVYSFGVVILEIVSGRKVFEQSRPEEERYLLTHFKEKAEQGQWLDLVDKCCLDVEPNAGEIEKMLKVSGWCVQSDHEKRPSMSMVIKVLEGVKDVEKDIDYNFLLSKNPQVSPHDVTPVLASVLSGPR